MGLWALSGLGLSEPQGKCLPNRSKHLSPKAAKARWGSFKRRFQPTKTAAKAQDEWERRGAQLERRVQRHSMTPRREASIFNRSRRMRVMERINGRSGAISDRYTGDGVNRSGKIEHSGRIFRSDRLEYQREEIRSKLFSSKGRYGAESPRQDFYYCWMEREAAVSGEISCESNDRQSQRLPLGSNAGFSGAAKGWANGRGNVKRRNEYVSTSFGWEEDGNSMQGSCIMGRGWGDTLHGEKLYQNVQPKDGIERQETADFSNVGTEMSPHRQERGRGKTEQELSYKMETNGDGGCWDEASSDDVRRRGEMSDSVSHVASQVKEADVKHWGEASEDDVRGRGQTRDTMSQVDQYDAMNQNQREDSFRYKDNGHRMDSMDAEDAYGVSSRRSPRGTRSSGSGWTSQRNGGKDHLSPLMKSEVEDPGRSKRRQGGTPFRSPVVRGLQGKREYSFRRKRAEVRFPVAKRKLGSTKKIGHSMGFLVAGSKTMEKEREEGLRGERRGKEGVARMAKEVGIEISLPTPFSPRKGRGEGREEGLQGQGLKEQRRGGHEGLGQRAKERRHHGEPLETGGVPGREGRGRGHGEEGESEIQSLPTTPGSGNNEVEKGKKGGAFRESEGGMNKQQDTPVHRKAEFGIQDSQVGTKAEIGILMLTAMLGMAGTTFDNILQSKEQGKDRDGEEREGKAKGQGQVEGQGVYQSKRRPATSNRNDTPRGQNSRLSSRIGSGRIRHHGIRTGHIEDESKRRPATSNGSQRFSGLRESTRPGMARGVKARSLFQMPENFVLLTSGVLVEDVQEEHETVLVEDTQEEDSILPDDSASAAGYRNRTPDLTAEERKSGFDSQGRKATPTSRRMPQSFHGRSRVHPMPADSKTEQVSTEAWKSRLPTAAPGSSSHHYQDRTKTRGVSQRATPKRDRIDQLHTEMTQANYFLDGLISMLGSSSIRDREQSSRHR